MSRSMRVRGNLETGLLSLTVGIVVYIVSRLFFGAIVALVESALPSSFSLTTLHGVVISAIGYAFDAAVVVLGLLGLYFVRSGRWALPSGGAAKVNLATMAFVVGAGAIVLRVLLGIAVGLTGGFTAVDVRVLFASLDLLITVALGLFLFWVLDGAGLLGPQVVGVVALVLTGVGSAVAGFARVLPRRVSAFDLTAGAGLLLFLLGLFLWLAAYVWGLGILRGQRPGRGAPAPGAEGSNR